MKQDRYEDRLAAEMPTKILLEKGRIDKDTLNTKHRKIDVAPHLVRINNFRIQKPPQIQTSVPKPRFSSTVTEKQRNDVILN